IAVLAIWCALGDQTAAVRLPLAMGLLVGGSCVFTLGLERLTENGEFNPARAMSPILLLSGVVMFTVVQLPAWGARLVLRRRIGLKSAPRSPAAGTFSLFYLLAVTAGAGVLAALLKSTVA